MSQADILNPSASSQLNPDYGYTEGLPEIRQFLQSQSGAAYSRLAGGRGHVYTLIWANRDKATMHALRQWERQYANDFFTFVDWERTRYYSGRFAPGSAAAAQQLGGAVGASLEFSPAGNERWNIRGTFMELPGLALYTSPINWTRDAIILQERDGFGRDRFKQTGTWTYGSNAFAYLGNELTNANANTTDVAEMLVFGYAIRIWARRDSNLGKLEGKLIRVSDGTVLASSVDVDLYSASPVAAAVYAPGNYPLNFYRVQIKATNTKNASSSAKTIVADAIEVMQ